MTNKILLVLVVSCHLFACTGNVSAQPNIVFILADDMPWWGTSVAQAEGEPRSTSRYRVTPNLERLAGQGMTFSSAYASAGMCAPSRASIQTGLCPARHLFSGNGNFGENCPEEVVYNLGGRNKGAYLIEPSPLGSLNARFITIGEKLKEQGYTTAHLGKWHVYGGGPEKHGYDVSDGETSNEEGKAESGFDPETDPKRIFSMTQKSMEFVEHAHNAGKPFYVQLSHYVEHSPQMALPETLKAYAESEIISSMKDKSGQKQAISHGAAVKDLDTSVGMILDCLDRLGIRENTYVIFSSDNGKDLFNGADSVLRGDKWWLWEAGIRVPFIIAGPGISPGSRSSLNTASYDLLPTFYDMAGGDPQTLGDAIDGMSLLPILKNQDVSAFRKRSLYFHYPHARNATPHSAIRKGEYKLYLFYEIPDRPYLYDLSEDLGEATNLAGKMPEKAQALLKDLTGYLNRVGAYLPKPNPDADTARPRFDPDKQSPATSMR